MQRFSRSLLVGTSNSIVAKEGLNKLDDVLECRLLDNVSCVASINEIFARNSALRYRNGNTLFLECFPNDVMMAYRGQSVAGDCLGHLSFLTETIDSLNLFTRIILVDLWPSVLKTPELKQRAIKISELRLILLEGYRTSLEIGHIEIGKVSTRFDNPKDSFSLNSIGLDEYVTKVSTLLKSSSHLLGARKNRRSSRIHLGKAFPIFYLDAARMLPCLPTPCSLDTYSYGTYNDTYATLNNDVAICLNNHGVELDAISISYLATDTPSFISIQTSDIHLFFDSSSSCSSRIKRVMPLPIGRVKLRPGSTLLIKSHVQPPPGGEEIIFEDISKTQSTVRNSDLPRDSKPGLFGLTFNGDTSKLFVKDSRRSTFAESTIVRHKSKGSKNVNLYPMGMWPGYTMHTHRCFSDLPGVKISQAQNVRDADAILVGVFPENSDLDKQYEKIISITNKPLVLYTNEHDVFGLPGFNQLNFDRYYACMSHYASANPMHIWCPMAVNWYGWNCVDSITSRCANSVSRRPWQSRASLALFCYSNPGCDYRNRTAQLLQNESLLHSCGGVLNNLNGERAPRSLDAYIDYCSDLKGYMAFENSSFPGYLTEKVLHGVMVGAKVFYWGDPLVNEFFDESYCLNLTGLSPHEAAFQIQKELGSTHEFTYYDNPIKPLFKERLDYSRESLARILLSLI
jgi:hypothetical protein